MLIIKSIQASKRNYGKFEKTKPNKKQLSNINSLNKTKQPQQKRGGNSF